MLNTNFTNVTNTRDKRELTALRRERDVAQTLINQLRASQENPGIHSTQAYRLKCNAHK